MRWPLQAPPVQPTELITIRLADEAAADDEIAAAENEVERPQVAAPILPPIPFVPAVQVVVPPVQVAHPVPTTPQHQSGIALAKPEAPSAPVAPEPSAAASISFGRPPLQARPVEAWPEAAIPSNERRAAGLERFARIDIPAELNAPASVPAAFIRMQFAEPPPALRPSRPPAELLDPKWRSAWVEAPAAPATVPVSSGQSASTNGEPGDQGQQRSSRNLQVPAAVLRLAARDGVQLSRSSDAADLVATVRDIARPGVAAASLMAAARAIAPQSDVSWTPMTLTMGTTPFAQTGEAAPAVAFAEALPALSPESVDQTVDHIVRTISLVWARGRAEAQIRLNPSHVGEVAVSVKVENGRVVVRLEAETAVVRDWLRANQLALSAALMDRELHLEQLEVSAPREESDGTSREQAHSRQSGRQAARRAKREQAGHLFEVVE
jgi:hypothetical protein